MVDKRPKLCNTNACMILTRFAGFGRKIVLKLDRRNRIIDMITQQRTIKNSELMEKFDISIETVRRDLEYLEQP